MGGEQAASVLATVRTRPRGRRGRARTFKAPIRDQYETQGSPYYATARLWDDGIIDPADTRRVLGMGLAAAAHAPDPRRPPTASSGCDATHDCTSTVLDRQPRRDRPARRSRTAPRASASAPSRSTPTSTPTPRTCARPTTRCGSTSYLDIDAVVAAARERRRRRGPPRLRLPLRARRLRRAPSRRPASPSSARRAEVMDAMGRKDAAREIAVAAGVPVVPAYALDDDPRRFGYPVLVKAAAGGGGKGMRVVRAAGELRRGGRRRPARGALGLRRRHHAGREVRRARPPHRGAGPGRRPRQRRPPLRARLLDPAPAPEGARGGAGADDHRRAARARSPARRSRWPAQVRLRQRRHRRVPARQRHRRGLLPGDEHPPPGRAPGHRGVGRPGTSTSSSSSCGSPPASRCRSPRTTSRSTGHAIEARVYAEDSFGGFLPAGRAHGDRRCAWPATRASRGRPRRSSSRAGRQHVLRPDARQGDRPRARPRGRPRAPWSPRSTRPRSSGSPPTSASCARWPRATSSATPPSTPPGSTATRCPAPDADAGPRSSRPGPRRCSTRRRRRGHPFQADGWRLGRRPGRRPSSSSTTRRSSSTGAAAPSTAIHDVRQVVGRRPHRPRSPSTAARARPCVNVQRARRRGGATAASGSSFERPDAFGDHARRRSATARSPRRCPAPSSTVRVADGRAGRRRARCSACWRR